jgi:hypothetical protein
VVRVLFLVLPIFWEVVGLERGSLSLVSTIEELLGRNSSGSDLEIREYGCRDASHWPCDTLYLQNVGTNLLTSGGRSVGIVQSRTRAMESTFFITNYTSYVTAYVSWTNQTILGNFFIWSVCCKNVLLLIVQWQTYRSFFIISEDVQSSVNI